MKHSVKLEISKSTFSSSFTLIVHIPALTIRAIYGESNSVHWFKWAACSLAEYFTEHSSVFPIQFLLLCFLQEHVISHHKTHLKGKYCMVRLMSP